AELLGHDEVQNLLATLGRSVPKLVEDLVPKLLPLSVVVKVLQSLLADRVPVRQMRQIVEALLEHGATPRTRPRSPPRCGSRWAASSSRRSTAWRRSCRSTPWPRRWSRCCRIRSTARARRWSRAWPSACTRT